MADVQLEAVDKVYEGGVHAVQDLSLDDQGRRVPRARRPLRAAARRRRCAWSPGSRRSRTGRSRSASRVVNDLSPKDRDIAMVFQNYALYPHLSVADNIAFGLRLRKTPKAEVDGADRVGGEAARPDAVPRAQAAELSGGQRQRVAMGRAIVRKPQVFLMDEPLSNLDAKLRVQMRAEIAKLQHELGTTTIYVTHDQVEAMTMGDRVAVMSMGVLQQVDRPQALYDEPANLFVASFIGTPPMNLFAGRSASRRRRRLRRDRPAVAAGRCRLRAPLRRDQGDGRAQASSSGCARRTCTRPQPRPDLPTLDATRRARRGARLRAVMAYFHIDADPVRPPGTHGAGPRRSDGDEGHRPARTSSPTSRRASSLRLGDDASRSRWTRAASTSSTRRRVRRFASCAIAAVARDRARRAAARRRGGRPAPAADGRGARAARAAADVLAVRVAAHLLRACRTGTRTATRRTTTAAGPARRSVTGYDPVDPGWYHGGDLKGLTGGCTDTKHGLARLVDLGFTAIWVAPVVAQQAVQARQRRVPRLLGSRLHAGRPALRHERGLRGVRRLRAPARAQGLPRRRRATTRPT